MTTPNPKPEQLPTKPGDRDRPGHTVPGDRPGDERPDLPEPDRPEQLPADPARPPARPEPKR